MEARGPARGLPIEWRKAILSCAVVFSIGAISTCGQDVAEAARQERARKAEQEKSAKHVYTDEDLKKKTILTPEDQARVEARKQQQTPAPAEQNAEQLPSNSDPNAESLGEIARRYRAEQSAREADQEAKKKFTAFPYQVPDDVLAEPKVGEDPLLAPVGSLDLIAPPAAPAPVRRAYTLHPSAPSAARGRVSPFQPRRMPNAPSVPPAAILPIPGMPEPRPDAPRVVEKTLPVPAAAPLGMLQIKVQAGQSWWRLAELYLGEGARWPELRKLNGKEGGSPELLMRGSKVLVPETAKNLQQSSHTITLQKGDTLWSLAQQHLRRGTAWVCLAAANPQIVDYTRMAVGTRLQLPSSCQSPR